MIIKGIGVDMEDISRFKDLDFNENRSFYEKIFTKKEIEYCIKKKSPYQHFAVRFCAKEAFIKAMSEEIKDYRSIEIKINKGKPYISWNGKNTLLSLSHEKDKAIAFVLVVEK